MDFLEELNESQRAAVEYNDGPLLVIAGAGSGKTRVLTYKIAYLLSHGVAAHHILALTFTNKAAREMKDRIGKLVGYDISRRLWMGTFHSICNRILRNEVGAIGYPKNFTIYDTQDTKSVIKRIIKEMQLDEKIYKPNTVLAKISSAKCALQGPEEYAMNRAHAEQDRMERMYNMADVYRLYNARLRQANAMDFDDLLYYVNILLRDHPDILEKYQNIFQHVLVDEYQDTNFSQYLIVRRLAEPQNHICVVGDDAQSIYSFRGATIENILGFQQGYASAKLFKLEQNYRSTQTIVKAANSLIHKNEGQIYKEVYSRNEEGDALYLNDYTSDREEALGVATSIRQKHQLEKFSYNDIAVLYRTNAQSRAFEAELRKLTIPYRIYGGMSFYQRKEVKDAIGYFRLVTNPDDTEALMRVINFPARGIGETTLNRVREAAAVHNVSTWQVVSDPATYAPSISGAIGKKLMQFAALVNTFIEKADSTDAFDFAEYVLKASGVLTEAAVDKSNEGVDRLENLQELLAGISAFVEDRRKQAIDFTPIADFLAEVSLLTDQDEHTDDQTPRVTLMTVHAAKGLEFPVVFVVGMEEQLFPSAFCSTAREMEEERRLLYVAITRAEKQCFLTYANQRFRNGSMNFSSPSRFLKDIDRQYLKRMGFTINSSYAASRSAVSDNRAWNPTPLSSAFETPHKQKPTKNLKPITASEPQHVEATTSTITDDEWKAGDRVTHKVFGDGTVKEVYHQNDNTKIDIVFDRDGKKTLLLTYAKLTRI